MLGPVEISGAGPFGRPKAKELVVYLALHRKGTTVERLIEDLWEAETVAQKTLLSIVSLARSALGHSAQGCPHLDRARAGRYQLGPAVSTD